MKSEVKNCFVSSERKTFNTTFGQTEVAKKQLRNRLNVMDLTKPTPSVDGPPTKAIILAPEPGTQTPNKLAAMLNAVPVHRDAR